MAFTKVVGAGIHTLSNIHSHNINSSGIITATKFIGPITGAGGDFNAGIVTATSLDVNGGGDISGDLTVGGSLTVNGDFTTLNTTLREVELLRVDASTSSIAGIITQSGSGHALYVDGTTILGNSQYVPSFSAATQLAVANLSGNSNSVDMTILGGRTGKSSVVFGDHDSNNRGALSYHHSNESINFYNNGDGATPKLVIASSGEVGVGTATPSKALHVDGTIFASGATTSLDGGLRIQPNNDGTNYGGVIYGGAHNDNNTAIYMRRGQDSTLNTIDVNSYATFRVFTGGALASQTQRLHIKNTGEVGINSTSPREKLDVIGNANIIVDNNKGIKLGYRGENKTAYIGLDANDAANAGSQSWANSAYIGFYSDGSSERSITYRTSAGHHIFQGVNGTEFARITSGGQVGIGTVVPQAKFVVSNAGANGFEFNPNFNSNNSIIASYNRTGGGSYSQLTLSASQHIFAQGGTEYGRFNASGRLGIGTASPDRMLHILGTGNAIVKMEANYSGSVTGIEGVLTASGANRYVTGIYGKVVNTSGSESNVASIRLWNQQASPTTSDSPGYITFNTTNDGASTATEKLRITSAGNIGIGTDNPGGTLDVLTSMGRIKFNNSGSIGSRIDFANADGTVRSSIHSYGGSNEILAFDAPSTIQFRISNSTKVIVTTSGTVGINTNNSGSVYGKLMVNSGTASNSATEYYGQDFAINIRSDRGPNPNEEGNGICFSQRWYTGSADIIRTGAIISYKTAGNGGFGGGLKFQVQQNGANALETAMQMGSDRKVVVNYSLKVSDAIQHNGDEDTQISFGTNTINLDAGGTTGLTVLDASVRVPTKLGINGVAPQTPLDVAANGSGYAINVRGRSSDNVGEIRFTSNDYGSLYSVLQTGATYLNIQVGSTTNALRITSDGKVGINDSAPANQLVVKAPGGSGHTVASVVSGDATTRVTMQAVQGTEGRMGMATNHPLQLYAGGSAQLTIGASGGFQFHQGNNNSPTYFNGGASGARNYVNVKAGNTTSGHYSGFGIINSSNSATWQFQVEHNGDDLDIFGNSAGGRVRFWTKDDGAASSTIKMQLTQAGELDAKPRKGNTAGSAYNMIPRGRAYEWSVSDLSPSSPYESGWYTVMDISDGMYMFWIGTNAHSSALITVCNGYDNSRKSTINCLHYCYNPNGNYLNIEKARVTKTGLVQVYLYASNPAYFSMYIQMISNDSMPNFYSTLTKDTSSPQVDHELDMKATGSSYNGMMQVKHLKVEEKLLMGTTGSIDMGFGPQVLTVRGGADAGYDGTAAAVFGQTDDDASCLLIYGSQGTYGSNLIDVRVSRSGSSAYNFAVYRSGGASDNEFIFRGDGNAFQDGGTTFSTPADYAEYFEWSDGNSANEDRRGMTVVLDGNKVKVATSSDSTDNIIGVVSGNPAVVGDGAWNKWAEKYLKDDFNNYILDSNDNRQLNPSYDSTKVYTPRAERQEWDAIGMVGKLRIRKGQQTGTRWIKMRDISDSVEEWLVR